jgi:predicted AAA+ superfamily ATPase
LACGIHDGYTSAENEATGRTRMELTSIGSALTRIADALERMAPAVADCPDLRLAPAYGWDGQQLSAFARIDAPPLALLRTMDRQRDTIAANIRRHAEGTAAHDMLLWGARGTGKSALVRAATLAAAQHGDLALVQIAADALDSMAALFGLLRDVDRRFIVFIDDIGFGHGEERQVRQLRSLLEGGVVPRPANIRIAVTANRRVIVTRRAEDQDEAVNPRDALDDSLALADRFGLSVGFHAISQTDYLDIVAAYATEYGLDWEESDALGWAQRRGARSGRVARHYITELAGRTGRALP